MTKRRATLRIASNANLFARRGDTWMTERDRKKDYPLSSPHYAEPRQELSADEIKMRRINNKMRLALGKAPLPILDKPRTKQEAAGDPEIDMFTKATFAKPKRERGPDKGKEIGNDDVKQGFNRILAMRKAMGLRKA